MDRTAKIWNSTTEKCILSLAGYKNRSYSTAFFAEGALDVTASEDHAAEIWNSTTGECLSTFTATRAMVGPPLSRPMVLRSCRHKHVTGVM